jgi:hypothetical protein
MKLFSHRKGLKPVRGTLQIDSMDPSLRSRLWNVMRERYWKEVYGDYLESERNSAFYRLVYQVWDRYFTDPTDTIGNSWELVYQRFRKYYFNCEWNEVYDFIEFISLAYPYENWNDSFRNDCNRVLKEELSGYRFVGKHITQITAEEEIAAVEVAIQQEGRLRSVSRHIEQALSLLADKQKPDYRNSIKEAISAVEAICQLVGGNPKATLGDAIKKMESKLNIHPALRGAFEKLYGYTNDAEGIRHALLEEPNLRFDDAKYMLVTCSAFINYLVAKSTEAGIKF